MPRPKLRKGSGRRAAKLRLIARRRRLGPLELATLRQEAAAFGTALAREHYLVGSGQKTHPGLAAIYRQWAHLFTPELIARARRGADQAGSAEQREAWHRYLGFLVRGLLDHAVRDQAEELQRLRLTLAVRVGGQAWSLPQIQMQLAGEVDRERRQELQTRLDDAKRTHLNPLAAAIVTETHRLAATLGYPHYAALWNDLKRLDLEHLVATSAQLLFETADIARQGLERDLAEYLGLSLDEVEPHDYTFLNRGLRFDGWFAADRMLDVLGRTLRGLGLDLGARPHIRLDLEQRPHKSPRAFCAGIRIPEEVVLVIRPQGGVRDYGALLHEAGHALHFGSTRPGTPYEYARLGDISVSEVYAFLFQHLLLDRNWLVEWLGMPDHVADRFLAFQRRSELMLVRRYAGKVRYEMHLHTAGGVPGQAEVYARELRAATYLPYRAVDYLMDLDPGFYSAQYLRAWMAEAQLTYVLRERWGSYWWRRPDAGAFLSDLWGWGLAHDAVELSGMLGFGALDVGLLVEQLTTPA